MAASKRWQPGLLAIGNIALAIGLAIKAHLRHSSGWGFLAGFWLVLGILWGVRYLRWNEARDRIRLGLSRNQDPKG